MDQGCRTVSLLKIKSHVEVSWFKWDCPWISSLRSSSRVCFLKLFAPLSKNQLKNLSDSGNVCGLEGRFVVVGGGVHFLVVVMGLLVVVVTTWKGFCVGLLVVVGLVGSLVTVGFLVVVVGFLVGG